MQEQILIKTLLRKKYQLPLDDYLCGSFQRDTEGAGIEHGKFAPKLEKGPDLLVEALIKLKARQPSLHVVLAGWRRQYIMMRLMAANIGYTYFERPLQDVINELYQTLDLYPITARHEGGPQSLIECGLLGVPVVSRPVGIASSVLPASAINDRVFNTNPAVPSVEHLKLPAGYKPYRDLIASL